MRSIDTTHSHAVGLFDSLKALGRNAIDTLHTRFELLVTELAEEQAHLVELLLVAAISLLCFFLGVVFAAFFVVIFFWETPYRLVAPGAVTVVLFIVAGILWGVFRNKAKSRGRFLAATLHELATDRDRLRR
ncbi:MAG: phage holin family protein [Pseudomonadota bacterium]